MIKDLVILANSLDKKGLTKEADLLDSIILKIAKDPASEMEAKQELALIPSSYNRSFDWPWETWRKLSDPAKEDFYDTISILEWIPILGVGAASAKFTLLCFEGKWSEAANALVFVILSIFMQKYFVKTISLIKSTPVAGYKEILRLIASDLTKRNMAIDACLNTVNTMIDKIINIFSKSKNFNQIATNLTNEKQNLRGYLEARIDEEVTKI